MTLPAPINARWWQVTIRETILLTVIASLLVSLGVAWRQLQVKDAAIEEYRIRVPGYDPFAEPSNVPDPFAEPDPFAAEQ